MDVSLSLKVVKNTDLESHPPDLKYPMYDQFNPFATQLPWYPFVLEHSKSQGVPGRNTTHLVSHPHHKLFNAEPFLLI